MRLSLGFVFALLACLQVFGLYLFLKGFLLTRQMFDLKGQTYPSWDRFPLSQSSQVHSSFKPPTSIPASLPFKRAIVIVIDALRFDFVIPSNNSHDPYFINQFPVLHDLYTSKSALLYQFRADPPTTTMQRVKGLMTGSLPTFIDAGSNFASSAVGEDHLLYHIKQNYPNIYFMGDDTWVNLFPEVFNQANQTYDSDSFKMLDLDSVDNDILSHLWPTVKRDDWQLLLAHFLGVDHCGHTYGPSDPNMQRKLNQMNSVIEELLPFVDKDTLLVIMGDHGMSVEGDHGGESVEELMSTLFLYSGRPSFKDEYMQQFSRRIHQSRAEKLDYDIDSISKRLLYNAKEYPIVAQIHLVPTLAYLLQIPIPFGNLGAILPDVLHPLHQGKNRLYHLLHMVEQFRTNALQVYDYLDQYAQQTSQLDFSFSKLNPLKQHLYRAESIMLSLLQEPSFLTDLESDSPSSLDAFTLQLEKAIFAYDTFLISTIKYCQSIWAQFDTGCMLLGVIILGLGTLTSFCLLNQPTVSSTSILKVALPVLSVGLLMVYARYSVLDDLVMSKGWFEKMDFVDWIGASVAIAICSSLLVIKPQATTSQFWNKLDWPLLILASIVQSFTLGSNSLVIWEDRGTLFVLGVLCIFWMVRNLTSIPQFSFVQVILAIIFPMGLLTLARIASFTGQCREEQFPHCNYFHNGLLIFEHSNEGYMSIALLVVTFTLLVYFGAHLGRITNMVVGGVYQISSIIVFYRTVYEIFSKTLDTGVEEKTELALMIQKYVEIYLPRGVYGLFFFGVLLAFIQLYYYSPGQEKRASRMCWTLFILATPVLALLQRPLGSAIILGSPFLIELLCQGAPSSLLIRLTILHFLGHHLFFTTGHQATFTSLPWKAAFIGFQDMHYYTGMVLVTLSTVAGYILTWLGWSVILLETMEEHKAQVSKECLHLLTLLHLIPTFLCAVFVFVLRRHLMTWKIFAPRFLFQVLLQVGAHVAAIISERFL